MVVYFIMNVIKYISYLNLFMNPLIILEDIGDFFQCVGIIVSVEKIGKEKILEQVALLGHIHPLKDCPFVLMNSDNIAGRIGRNILNTAGFTADVKVTSDNIETLLSLCIDDCGACFCPELLVRRALTPETMAKLRLIRLGEDAKYKIRFGYAKQNYQWHAIDEFINIAVKSLNDKAL